MTGQEPKPVTVAASEATALGLQGQLHAAFAERAAPPVPPSAATPLEACLRPLLDALHWTGDERRLFEASPHLEPIESIGAFRAVLLRIGFRTIPTRLALDRLASQFLPALVERHGGAAELARRCAGEIWKLVARLGCVDEAPLRWNYLSAKPAR